MEDMDAEQVRGLLTERNKLNKAKPLISCVLEMVTMQVQFKQFSLTKANVPPYLRAMTQEAN